MEATDDVVQSPAISAPWNRFTPLLPGIWASLAVSIAAVCTGWGEERVFGRPIIEPLVVAILYGMLVRAVRAASARQETGIRFVAKDVLEVAVCLLGATMDVQRLFASGPALAIGIVIVVAVALSGGYLIGRVVGLSPKLAVLVACG